MYTAPLRRVREYIQSLQVDYDNITPTYSAVIWRLSVPFSCKQYNNTNIILHSKTQSRVNNVLYTVSTSTIKSIVYVLIERTDVIETQGGEILMIKACRQYMFILHICSKYKSPQRYKLKMYYWSARQPADSSIKVSVDFLYNIMWKASYHIMHPCSVPALKAGDPALERACEGKVYSYLF